MTIDTENDTGNIYLEYEQSVIDQLSEERLAPSWESKAKEFISELWTFSWSRGDDVKGEFDLSVDDRGDLTLKLVVYALDNDDEQDDEVKRLTVTAGVSMFKPARDQMRELIHSFLCHEADEQMHFADALPFDPHAGGL